MTGSGPSSSLLLGPPRRVSWVGWLGFLLLDVAIVAALPKAPLLAGAAVSVLLLVPLVQRPILAAGVAAYGAPLLWPIGLLGFQQVTGYFPTLLLVLPLLAIVGDVTWEFPRFGPRAQRMVRGLQNPLFVCALVFGVWLLIRTIGTPSPLYGRLKTYVYFITSLPLLLVGLVHFGGGIRERDRTFARFVRVTLVVLFLFSVAGIWNSITEFWPYDGRLRVLGMNPIWVARYTGVGIILASTAWAGRGLRARVAVPLLATLTVPFYLAGSRGPLLSLLLALVLWWTLGGRIRLRVSSAAVLVALAALFVLAVEFGFVLQGSPLAEHQASNILRALLLKVVYDQGLLPGLWGLGTGGFAAAAGVGDIRAYPHNILLEIWVELGLVGVLVFLAWVGALVRLAVTRWRAAASLDRDAEAGAAPLDPGVGAEATALDRREPRVGSLFQSERSRLRVLAALTFFTFANAQFSGDISANQFLWLWAGLLAAPILPYAAPRTSPSSASVE
ncbi:MAG: hypothetical protein KDA27_06455 [Candidatus Eisenbacteria bacterium]|uniref:O-antigen ligase-related domain-containing protein n=1 Tax=Eiseniibacteriota bacterium TaxID=2212470 RepID=A0A956SEK9_UNCEI|nr:hypothetical protein [Candidatus Eisenbacteria bacterium]MCB9463235.1 hypothetical protein [Candidatus Eisenbacteria bacterium]